MKQSKSLKIVCAISFSFLISSCVNIKNTEWFGYMADDGAISFNTLDDGSRYLTKKEFDEMCAQEGCIVGTSHTFAYWKGLIIKLCKVTKRCSYDDFKSLEKFEGPQK